LYLLPERVNHFVPTEVNMRKLLSRGLAVALVLGLTGTAWGQGDAKAVIEKAITAQGGAKNLDKLKASRTQGKGTVSIMGQDFPFTIDLYQQMPDKVRTVLKLNINGMDVSIVQILNGDKGWAQIQGMTMDADADALGQMKASVYAARLSMLTPLTGSGYTLTTLGESKVNGKAAVGVKVASAGQKDVSLYFDKDSGLLVKLTRPGVDPVGKKAVTQDEFYSDYKDFEGVKQPTKMVVHHDGNQFMVATLSQVSFVPMFEAKMFARPE